MASLFDRMQALLEHPTLEAMWDDWDKIANEIIPTGFDMRDALEESDPPSEKNIDEEWIRDRIDYLSDRADSARMYWLDFCIRRLLGKENQV